MTVADNARKLTYNGDGASTNFSVTFEFYEIAVYVGGTLQTEGVDYSITQTNPGETGTVVFTSPPASGTANVVIIGSTTPTQSVDYSENDPFPAETHEGALDRLTMIVRELSDKIDAQTLRVAFEDPSLPELDLVGNPDSVLITDGSGVPTMSGFTAVFGTQVADAEAAQAAAEAAQAAAEAAQASAESSYDSFDDRYLGSKASAPTLDNDGNALITGALFFNTTTNELGVYNGSSWEYPALEASTSASNAATSESNAATSESNASTSASSASTSASTATTKASEALTSANNAATSEANAATSETNAAASETAALAAQVAAEAVFDNFDDKYLGSKASDPTLDNDGDPLTDGTLYYNTTVNALRVYDLGTTSWISFPVSDASFVTFTPVGDIAATDVQSAIAEVDAEKAALSHAHAASDVTSGTFADARIAATNVTQHQAALSITESQISDLGNYSVVGHTHAASDVTSGTFADARIAASNVTQHQASLTITESQISDLEKTFALTIEFNGGGAAIAASSQVDAIVPYAGTISSYTVLADQSTTAVIDVWKDTYANYPPTVADSIVASADISLTADDNNQDSTLTGWTKSVSAGDILRFNVDSNNNAERIFIILYIERT